MKELTDKVNMDNLSLIIKTLRSKATSSTFFNKSNTKLLLKLAVAFYQFKDKSLEELIFTDAKYDESGCHDSFLDDLIKCINLDEIKNSNNQYVKNFLERIGAKKTDLNETYLKEADDKDNNKKLNIDSSYNLTLNTDALNKLGISIYDSYPYTELKANLCSFINKLNIEHLKDSVQDTPSANGKADSNNALSPAKRNKGTVLDTDTVIFDNFFNAADELFSNTFFHEQRLVKVLCDYLSESCSQDNDKVLFLSNVLPYAEYSLLNDHNCSIDSFVNVDSKMSIDAKVNFEALKRFDENLKKTSSHAQGLKSDSLNLNEKTVFLRDYEANLVPEECKKQVDAAGNADIDNTSYLHTPSLELNFVRALLLQINSPLKPYVSRQELIDNPHSAAFVCQPLFKGDIQNLCKYYYSLYNLLKRTVQKRFVLFIPHVITYTNANEGFLFRKTLLEDNYLSAVLRLPRFFCADKDLLIDVLVFDKENVSNIAVNANSEVLNTASSDSKKAYSKITDLKITDKKLLLCNLSTANGLDEKLSSRAHSVLALKAVNEVSHALSCLGANSLQKNSEHCKFVSLSSIKSNADKLCKLDPTAYVSPTDVLDSVAYIKKGTVELDKIATIYKALTCKAPADTDFKEKLCELNLNDVPESGIITSVPKEVEVELGLKQAKRNLLIDGDVVISVKGAVGKVGFYKEGQKKVMAGQCFAIIRSKDPDLYSQELIFALLRNDDMQDYIKTKITGDKLKVLQLSELKAIPLPAATESMKAKACRITQELYDSQIKLIEIKESVKALGQVRLD
ncbi:type I restriction modification DNA specificity domain protein [Succinatimonas sp. CAG:777]|nr:type I restriction modification DNA specificity domain protein [Succinatimonas sp. CAG:777]